MNSFSAFLYTLYLALFFTKSSMTYYQTDSRPLWSLCIDHVTYQPLSSLYISSFICNETKIQTQLFFSFPSHFLSKANKHQSRTQNKNDMPVGNVLKYGRKCILSNSSYYIRNSKNLVGVNAAPENSLNWGN